MARVSLEGGPDRTTCDVCGDLVLIPPGVVYRGLKLHKGCARRREAIDFSEEIGEPAETAALNELESYFDNMGSMV